MAGNGNAKIIDLKEELTPLHTGLWGNTTNITKGDIQRRVGSAQSSSGSSSLHSRMDHQQHKACSCLSPHTYRVKAPSSVCPLFVHAV